MSDEPPFTTEPWKPAAQGNGADKDRGAPPIGNEPVRFTLEDWNDVTFDPDEEWLIEGVLSKRGLGLIFGKPKSFKSFVAKHFGLCVALGIPWAGRRVEKGSVVYIAAEGASGLRKRIAAYKKKHKVPRGQFNLLSAAPNLGTSDGDLPALIAAVESAGVKPALIVVDTAAKSIGAAEENGAGMAAFIGNAEKLAQHFGCFVLAVHHVGWDDQKRPRGWSGLIGALDLQMLCERSEREKRARLTVQKLKDDDDDICFEGRLSRVVVGHNKNGREVSTLIVDDVVETQPETAGDGVDDGSPRGRRSDDVAKVKRALVDAYERLADSADKTTGFDGAPVKKVEVDKLRDEVRSRGFLETKEENNTLTSTGRSHFRRAKTELIVSKRFIEADGKFWRLRPEAMQ